MGSGTAGVEVTFTITGSLFESWQSLSDIYFTGKNNNEDSDNDEVNTMTTVVRMQQDKNCLITNNLFMFKQK